MDFAEFARRCAERMEPEHLKALEVLIELIDDADLDKVRDVLAVYSVAATRIGAEEMARQYGVEVAG